MRLRMLTAFGLILPAALAAQSPPPGDPAAPVMFPFESFADLFGSRLVAAFVSIPASRYNYRPTPSQQTIGYIAQHLEAANYSLCERFSDLKHPRTRKDSLADTIKARWPKDTLVARLEASLRFCDTTIERVGRLESGALSTSLLAFETDLAEHYSQLSVYMRLLGMVPPSALPPKPRVAKELPASTLSPLVGVYQLVAGPQLDVTMRDGVLFVKSSGGGATVRLWAEGPNDFFVKEVDAQLTFTRDPNGAIAGLIVHQYGRDRVAKRLAVAHASGDSARRARECPSCAEWNMVQRPLRIFGNAFYVGTHGLAAVLVTSPRGHVLIDGGLPESAPLILANIRALGFRVEDVKVILNSHAHYDHAGGIAAIHAASGGSAEVDANPWSAGVIERGASGREDPQFGLVLAYPGVPSVHVIADGQVVRVGDLALTAHFTGGHTPGGTTWTWRSCEGDRCLDLVYADSQTPASADGFLYSRSAVYPSAIADFEHAFTVLEHLPCDILITPHPSASNFWERVAARDSGNAQALVDREACRRYATHARKQLADRLATEAGKQP